MVLALCCHVACPTVLHVRYSQGLPFGTQAASLLQGLDLRGNCLNGTIPTAVMGMPWMTWLYLGANPSLAGTLPPMALYNLVVSACQSCKAELHGACTCLAGSLPPFWQAQDSDAMLHCTSHRFKTRSQLKVRPMPLLGLRRAIAIE